MATIIILIVILILALVIVPFTRDLVKDKLELQDNPINKKFEVLVSGINQGLMGGKGDLTLFDDDPKFMNLMNDDMQNMLISFFYSTGNLTITLRYKYFHKELKYEKQFSRLRNISTYEQKDIANEFVEECRKRIHDHQQKVTSSAKSTVGKYENPIEMDDDPTNVLSSLYDNLSAEQKKSLVNLLFLIGSSDGTSEMKIQNTIAFSQLILSVKVPWEECKKQYLKYGENKIINDLKGVDDGIMAMIIMSCIQLMSEINAPQNTNPKMEQCFFNTFNKLGYSPDRIENTVQKVMLLHQTFMG